MQKRLNLKIQGLVQGVGFRPFVYQLATELGLTGWVKNTSAGVLIELEGDRPLLETFLARLPAEKPYLAEIQQMQATWLDIDTVGYSDFKIKHSTGGEKTALILPDIATCPQCLQEIFDPNNRRYLYPFTNCTNCGPRFSIIEALPYDRPQTTMKQFKMCACCLAEYQNPHNRRFHAQPNACPDCGPHLELWDSTGKVLAEHHQALLLAAAAIRQGKIIALKGLGGFQLIVDARNQAAIEQLRQRKNRPDKPFALMYPHLQLVKAHCQVSALEAKLLLSPQSPIILLKKLNPASSPIIQPANNPYLGIMLPYTPLHHLLMSELGFPIVATSGNLAGEPICIDNQEALTKLNAIADLFLVHNRPLARPVDDSILQIMEDREQILRRARGYAPLPLPVHLPQSDSKPVILSLGGQLKNTIALLKEEQIFLSQYIGDLETVATFERWQTTIKDWQRLYELKPSTVACDRHPHYLSTNYAQQLNLPLVAVQHHYAHVLACMADNKLNEPETVLGVAWDGTGYGLDDTIWGGEFLSLNQTGFTRVARLKTFKLPGGDRAIKEPKRIAIALLDAIFGDCLWANLSDFNYLPCIRAFSKGELTILGTMVRKNLNTPITSSMGRLFAGVAAILGICQQISYEGQAAMELEFAIADVNTDRLYEFELIKPTAPESKYPIIIDWTGIIKEILTDLSHTVPVSLISAKFHNTLVEIVIAIAKIIGRRQIVLTGGCWQNKYLTERAIARLRQENFIPYWHHHVPGNDGGIALGQIIAAMTNAT